MPGTRLSPDCFAHSAAGRCCASHKLPCMDLALLTTFMLLPADSCSKQSPAAEAARGPQHQPVQNKASERATSQPNSSSSIVETSSDTVQQRLPHSITHSVPLPLSHSAQPAEAGQSTRASSKGTADSSTDTQASPGTETVSTGVDVGDTGALSGLAAQESVQATQQSAPGDQHTASAAERGRAPAEEPVSPAEAPPAEGPARPGKKASKLKHRSCKQQ